MNKLIFLSLALLTASCGLLDEEQCFQFSYYLPGSGTFDRCTFQTEGDLEIVGSSSNSMIIIESFGKTVSLIDSNNTTIWRTKMRDGMLMTVAEVTASSIHIDEGDYNTVLDLEAGEIISRYTNDKKEILMSNGEKGYIGKTAIFHDFNPTDQLSYARGMDTNGTTYAIADTFNHRVIIYGPNGRHEFWEYYPNDVKVISDDEVVIVGEHSNRVTTYNLQTSVNTLNHYCDFAPFNGPTMDRDPIIAYEVAFTGDTPDCQGRELFSPNGIHIHTDGSYAIADTDNHRVLEFDENGNLIREITNLNAPVRVWILED